MARRPVHFFARRAIEAMVNSSLVRYGELPIPQDTPVLHATGPDPDRILLIGTGAVRGQGVTSNELGLGGQLARRLAPLTGRGVDIELASTTTLLLAQVPGMLDGYDTSRFDAIILLVGVRDVVSLTGEKEWRRDMRKLLEVASRVPRVFVMEIPGFTQYLEISALAARMMRQHSERLNDATRSIAADMVGVEFVPFAPKHPGYFVAPGSIAIYESWAAVLAPAIAPGLDPLQHRLRPPEATNDQARQDALDALGVRHDGVDNRRVDRIVRMARELLMASGACVVFLDSERPWMRSAVSLRTRGLSRGETFCNVTIQRPELFVVEDAAADARFDHHPWVVGDEGVRFYAGYPIEAPDGVRVGALCVVDTTPRQFSAEEAALLRKLALQVQSEMWSDSKRLTSEA